MLETLRQLRKFKGVTMKDVGAAIGVSEATVSLYERGLRSPSYEVLLKLGEYFGVSVDYLLNGVDFPNQPNLVENQDTFADSERQKKLDLLAEEIREGTRRLKAMADSTYDFYSSLSALVGLSEPIPRYIAFKPQQSDTIEDKIKSLVKRFLETANSDEQADFWLQYDKIGQEFRERIEHPEKTPYPSPEEIDTLVGNLTDELLGPPPEDN